MKKQMFIGGQWVDSQEYYDLRSPFNGEVIATIPLANEEEVTEAINQAELGSKVFREMTSLERANILERASDLFQEKMEECAKILALECSKPIKIARGEISRTIETYKFAAEEAKRISGETIPMDAALSGKNRFGFTIREPLGIIAAITPFNFPYNLVAHKLGPAIAAGNSVVLKPANQTPLSALMTAEIFEEAGLPNGVLNVVTGRGSVIGDILIRDPRVKMVTFTGSKEVGVGIRAKAGLKKVVLELGSNAAVVIDSVDELDEVVARCVEGAFSFSGQVCIAVQRIYVNESLYDSFLQKFTEKASELKFGDPLSEETDISAMIHKDETKRVDNWLKEAEEEGATVVYAQQKAEGNLLGPTIITNSTSQMGIIQKEAFAPIVSVIPYESWDQAIAYVNDSNYGLQAGVYTQSVKKAFDAIKRLEVGGVIVNDIPTFRVDQMPYGGVKDSGTGREGIKYSIEEMTELKFASFKN